MSTAVISSLPFAGVAHNRGVARAVATPRLRITRRGRMVLTTLVAVPLVLAAMFATLNGEMATATGTSGLGEYSSITVLPGDTLWGLAAEIAPGVDPREVVEQLLSLNALESAVVVPGQSLLIPADYDG